MSAKIVVTRVFSRAAKKLFKKYKSLKQEIQILVNELKDNPHLGIRIGENIFKIRLAIKSKGRGKSGGARVITYVEIEIAKELENEKVYLFIDDI